MGRKHNHKHNKRKHSSDNTSSGQLKVAKHGGSQSDTSDSQCNESVSETLHNVNSVLFEDAIASVLDNSVFTRGGESPNEQSVCSQDVKTPNSAVPIPCQQTVSPKSSVSSDRVESPLQSVHKSPLIVSESRDDPKTPVGPETESVMSASESSKSEKSNLSSAVDIAGCLRRIENKLNSVDQKLESLDKLEAKVNSFEKSMSNLWNFVRDQTKTIDGKVIEVIDRVESLEFSLGQAQSEISSLRRSEGKVKDDLLYVQSQSMRNNLIFGNIDEQNHETHEQTEAALRRFFVDNLRIAEDLANSLKFERVHRMGRLDSSSRACRKIVAKFTYFRDREMVRKQRGQLKDTDFFMHEQFPPEISARRSALLPQLKAAKRDGKQAWFAYDTLYIDGVAVKDDGSSSRRSKSKRE